MTGAGTGAPTGFRILVGGQFVVTADDHRVGEFNLGCFQTWAAAVRSRLHFREPCAACCRYVRWPGWSFDGAGEDLDDGVVHGTVPENSSELTILFPRSRSRTFWLFVMHRVG